MTISKAAISTVKNPGILDNKTAANISCISYQSMRRSSRVLREFVLYYFPIYNLSMNDFFRFYPILGFIEALVYQTDDEVEKIQSEGHEKLHISPWNSKQELILSVLEECNIKHSQIEFYLTRLGDYFELETQLLATPYITHEMIKAAAELRSSDYRVLHCTLKKMLNSNYKEEDFKEELNLMWSLEVLNDIEDDIIFYAEDVVAKHYNTYRMFIRVYGDEAPYYIKKELAIYENLFHQQIAQFSKLKQIAFMKAWNAYRLDHPVPVIPEPIIED
jgi:hypothetical protein